MSTLTLLEQAREAGEDFEWYPTTDRIVAAALRWIPENAGSIMDIGAGDGRVLEQMSRKCKRADLYAIEKSTVLINAQPDRVVPVGANFEEQNLACLPVDYIFCNPPYSEYETWASMIIDSGYAQKAFLVIPQRWENSAKIKKALEDRGATARTVHTDHFLDADRQARAVIDVVEISYPQKHKYGRGEVVDPFDIWFDQHIDTFDPAEEISDEGQKISDLARIRGLESVAEMVQAYNEEYERIEKNYRAIFELDHALLKELGVSKSDVREGIKVRMSGLKSKYWTVLFERLDVLTKRLSTKTRRTFLETINKRSTIAFTANNCYAVTLWAIKNANRYYDEQLVTLFRTLTEPDCVENYKSNQKTWEKNGWRFMVEDYSHYMLDYRIITGGVHGIYQGSFGRYEYPGNLHKDAHARIADIIAVLNNLGFTTYFEAKGDGDDHRPELHRQSDARTWHTGKWQDFVNQEGETLFQVKGFMNGNLHLRFKPEVIKAMNIEAGRLLGWIQSPQEVENEMGYDAADAERFFRTNVQLGVSSIKLLAG